MTPEELEGRGRKFFDLMFNQRNLTLAEEMLAGKFVEHLPPLSGPGGATSHFKELLDRSDDLRVQVVDVVTNGRQVAIRARYSGTDTGGVFPGVPARGRRFDVDGIDLLVVDDQGKFVEHIGIVDMKEVMEQLGIVSSA